MLDFVMHTLFLKQREYNKNIEGRGTIQNKYIPQILCRTRIVSMAGFLVTRSCVASCII